jgi:micrococcal nuclease
LLAIGLALCLLVIARYWWVGPAAPSPAQALASGLHRVVRVVDGDTIIVAPDNVVRLIGVDTPEAVKPEHPVEPYAREATQFTRRFLAAGAVHLEFDRERVDRFGRFLAYVWVGDRLLNEELLRVGLARFEPNFRYSERMKYRFRQAQEEAQRAEIGIWSNLPDEGAKIQIHRRPYLPDARAPRVQSAILLAAAARRPRSVHFPIICH